jgi:small subunit ribosomal protein S7
MQKTIIRHLEDALANVMPHVEVRSRRVVDYISNSMQIDQTEKFLWQWLILYSRRRNEKSMAQRLASECLAAAKEEGAAVKNGYSQDGEE